MSKKVKISDDLYYILKENGTKRYYNNLDQLHRVDGPAIEYSNGDKSWYLNGLRHRTDGPAIDWKHNKEYFINNKNLTENEFNKIIKACSGKTIDKFGTIEYKNLKGQYHRLDGPAIEDVDGNKYWYLNAKVHRENGPAVEWNNGYKAWYINGLRHREDGPAIEDINGYKAWYLNGEMLSENEFIERTKKSDNVIRKVLDDGTVEYRNSKNELHRLDGPAVEWNNKGKDWYVNGKRHRVDGPAIECFNGYKAWYLNGQRHRFDGPAIEDIDGYKAWFINGEELTEKKFNKLISLKRINEQTQRSNDETKTIDEFGTIKYRNSNGQLHRLVGPALEYKNEYKAWYLNGQRHRLDGPAIEWNDGYKKWYINGEQLTEKGFNKRTKFNYNYNSLKEYWLPRQPTYDKKVQKDLVYSIIYNNIKYHYNVNKDEYTINNKIITNTNTNTEIKKIDKKGIFKKVLNGILPYGMFYNMFKSKDKPVVEEKETIPNNVKVIFKSLIELKKLNDNISIYDNYILNTIYDYSMHIHNLFEQDNSNIISKHKLNVVYLSQFTYYYTEHLNDFLTQLNKSIISNKKKYENLLQIKSKELENLQDVTKRGVKTMIKNLTKEIKKIKLQITNIKEDSINEHETLLNTYLDKIKSFDINPISESKFENVKDDLQFVINNEILKV